MSDAWYQRAIARARSGSAPAPAAPQQQRYQPTPGIARWEGHTQLSQPTLQQGPAPQEKLQQASVSDLLHNQALTGKASPGIGGRLNPDPCPQCGKDLFYENLGKTRRGPPPAPHCFTCGYNGMFEQGLEANWQGAGA
jgi:hypothetical protein